MKKYLAIFITGFKDSLVYRIDLFLWGINEFIWSLVFLYVWSFLFGEKNTLGGFTLSETITYLIGVGLIDNIISTLLTRLLERDIQTGRLSDVLIKPVNYPLVRLFLSLSRKPFNLFLRFIIYFALITLFKKKIIFPAELLSFLLTIFSIIFAFFINFFIDFLVGCVSFWTITTEGTEGCIRTFKNILSGDYAPITFFPFWFQKIAGFLPFIYLRYFPMLIYLKKVSTIEAIKGIGIQIFWIIVLFYFARFVWRKGIKQYEGVGI